MKTIKNFISNFKMVNFKKAADYLKSFIPNNWLHPTFWKVKLVIITFMVIYSIFIVWSGYLLYKSYHEILQSLNEQIYQNLTRDISNLNFHKPILFNSNTIPTKTNITNTYGALGIINYNDYNI